MNLDGVDLGIILPAFVAGLLVTGTHVPLGREVLSRGIIFVDLAVAQIAALGVILAYALGWDVAGVWVQLAAVASALAGALALHWTERRWPQIQEALIGTAFVLAATAGLLLLAGHPHGAERMKELLSGQILWVQFEQLWPVAVLYAVVMGLWIMRQRDERLWFYIVFALTVTASVQLVGVYLVFASLIIPALAVRELPDRPALWLGYGLGAAGYALGLVFSALFDLPAGPVIVWTLALLGAGLWAMAARWRA